MTIMIIITTRNLCISRRRRPGLLAIISSNHSDILFNKAILSILTFRTKQQKIKTTNKATVINTYSDNTTMRMRRRY